MNTKQNTGYDDSQPGLQARLQGGLEFTYVGKGIYEARPHPTRYIAMTGSAVAADYEIGFSFRLVRLQWKHTDNVNADNATATAIFMDEASPVTGLWTRLYAEAASTSASTLVPFGEGYEYAARTIRISGNTSNTHRIYPVLWVQELR